MENKINFNFQEEENGEEKIGLTGQIEAGEEDAPAEVPAEAPEDAPAEAPAEGGEAESTEAESTEETEDDTMM